MALPLVITLAVAGPLVAVRPADVDGDGQPELVLASAASSSPDSGLTLEVVHLGATGETGRETWSLPGRAAWWDAGHGLWKADATGLVNLLDGTRVLTRSTALPARGAARPGQAGMVEDLDGDGTAELLFRTKDEVVISSTAGTVYGTVPAPPRTELTVSQEGGGQVLRTTLVSPPIALADWDGDGVKDVLVVGDKELSVYIASGGAVRAVPQRIHLPRALTETDTIDASGVGSQTTSVHWADLTGDGKADLLVHRLLASGKLTGNDAEVQLFRNTGTSLASPQVVRTGAASKDAFLVDFDHDGDLDVLLPQVHVDVGSLAQAVFDRSMDVQLTLLPNEGGTLGEARKLGDLALPIEGSTASWSLFEDLDGDGLPDLALAVAGELRLHPGDGSRLASKPSLTLPLGRDVTNLWALDLTGDGAVELVGWTPEARQLVVVRLR